MPQLLSKDYKYLKKCLDMNLFLLLENLLMNLKKKSLILHPQNMLPVI